jgi:hypothetical protein
MTLKFRFISWKSKIQAFGVTEWKKLRTSNATFSHEYIVLSESKQASD